MRQELLSHTLSGPAGSTIRTTMRISGNEKLAYHFNHRAVLSVSMNPHSCLAICNDGARNIFQGYDRTVWNNRVVGPWVPGLPSRTGRQGHAPESSLHRPSLPGYGDTPPRPLRLRVQRSHAPRPILTHSKVPSGFAIHHFTCLTHRLSRAGLTGFTINQDGRFAMRDAQ